MRIYPEYEFYVQVETMEMVQASLVGATDPDQDRWDRIVVWPSGKQLKVRPSVFKLYFSSGGESYATIT